MFPFASHEEYGYSLDYAEKELKVYSSRPLFLVYVKFDRECQAAGDLARKYGHRLTSHPGQVRPHVRLFMCDMELTLGAVLLRFQFTQLGSPREAVVTSAIRELECRHRPQSLRVFTSYDGAQRCVVRPLTDVPADGSRPRQRHDYPHGCMQFSLPVLQPP